MTWGRTACVVAVVTLGIALAGCGDDDGSEQLSAEQYTQEMSELGDQADAAHESVNAAFKSDSVPEIQELLLAFADDQEAIGDEADELEPPEDAAEANQQLADGLQAMAEEIRAAADSLSDEMTPDEARKEIDSSLSNTEAVKQVDSALSELRDLGYTESG